MAFALNRPTATLGVANAILCASARQHSVRDFPGPLSIKSVTRGTVAWKTGGRELVVDRDSFLLLHEGEPYSMEIDAREPVSTLCVFFAPGFVEAVAGSMASGESDAVGAPVRFAQRLHAADTRILPRMQAIAAVPMADQLWVDQLWVDQQFVDLASDLALLNREVQQRVRMMPARRVSTREELFRRVRRGQEFLHAAAGEEIGLSELAREACLSPYHLHRAFTQAFGQTPHAYRTGLRLARARRLLESSGMTVMEVCVEVGFASAASFTNLFRRTYGVPPSALAKIRKIR
jgi:AraC family transcriptional regulator